MNVLDFYRGPWTVSVMSEKSDFADFLRYVQEWQENNPNTWKDLDPNVATMPQVFEEFDLNSDFSDFAGCALALFS